MSLELPAHPNLTQLKKQAKELKAAAAAGDAGALSRIETADPSHTGEVTLRLAQLTIAREYGFPGWHALSTEVGRRMVEEGDLHRWFGVELNNTTWDAIDAGVGASGSLTDRESLLYSAYASAYHWRQVGTIANVARGEHLIARTALAVGMPDIGLRHAKRCLELVEANPDEVADWDLGFALEAMARAEAASGRPDAAATLERARQAAAAVSDPEERAIVEAQFDSGEWFGLI